jgi:hypothetical protein
MEVVFLELEAEGQQIENANKGRELIPSHNLVHSLEDLN